MLKSTLVDMGVIASVNHNMKQHKGEEEIVEIQEDEITLEKAIEVAMGRLVEGRKKGGFSTLRSSQSRTFVVCIACDTERGGERKEILGEAEEEGTTSVGWRREGQRGSVYG